MTIWDASSSRTSGGGGEEEGRGGRSPACHSPPDAASAGAEGIKCRARRNYLVTDACFNRIKPSAREMCGIVGGGRCVQARILKVKRSCKFK